MATTVLDYRLVVDDKNHRADSFFPGITYDDFDRAGGVSPWKICRMFEAGRTVPFYQGNFIDYNTLRANNCSYFVLGGDYYFDPCLWEVARKYHYFPYKIRIELINIGQTSLSIRQVLVNLLDNKEVATYYGKLVYVDRETKRPQALPYWFRTKYHKVESPERVRIDTTLTRAPNHAFKFETVVAASDTDHNGHTNQASYVRYCLDAAEAARRGNEFQRLTKDICLYPILKLSSSYRAETLVGDPLTICVWEDDLSPMMLNFAVFHNETLAYTSTVTFKSTPCSKL